MKSKIILAVTAVTVGVLVASVLLKQSPNRHNPAAEKAVSKTASMLEKPPAGAAAKVAPLPVAVYEAETSPTVAPTRETTPGIEPAGAPVQNPSGRTNSVSPKEPLRDPIAREALSFVGIDPGAEAYWMGAIFDKNLPDEEREDLMEDLNEEGFSDPKHPGPQDLPLILSRIQIIEEVAPYADDFMLEHLGEAYKDLNNMLAGNPVQ